MCLLNSHQFLGVRRFRWDCRHRLRIHTKKKKRKTEEEEEEEDRAGSSQEQAGMSCVAVAKGTPLSASPPSKY